MKADEKQLIFNLLKNASAHFNGYTKDVYKSEQNFTDDAKPEQNVVANSEQSTIKPPIESQAQAQAQVQVQVQVQSQNEVFEQNQIQTPAAESSTQSSKTTMEEIATKIARCTRCSLARTRNNVVPGMGVENPDVLVIGEGPGYDEDKQGLPFVGKAGILLDKMLAAIGLDRKTNCYIANIVKCRPPQNRDPFPQEQDACFSFLEAQINILKPKMILCMGKISSNKMLNQESPIGTLRGQIFEYNNIPLMVTYHPSALLRNEQLKRPAWDDLKMFKAKLDEIKQK